MLASHGIALQLGEQQLFEDVTFHINPGERIGLVGPNGSGKSSLLAILAGQRSPDAGHVGAPNDLRVGYLPQGDAVLTARSVQQVLDEALGDPDALGEALERHAKALAANPDDLAASRAYDDALERMSSGPGRLPAWLGDGGLAVDDLPPDLPVASLSGGEKARLAIALLFLDDPDLLLLDEPTNHLDVAALDTLEQQLRDFEGGLLVVSHDRRFLDAVCNRILALDPKTRRIQAYAGNYSDFVEARETERTKQMAEWRDQQAEIKRVRQDIAQTREQARHVEITTKPNQPSIRRYAKKVAKKAQSRERKLERYIDADERVERPDRSWEMRLDFDETLRSGKAVLVFEGMSLGYPGEAPLVRDIELHLDGGARVTLEGPNGSGKTSLLRAIQGEMEPTTGRFRLGAGVVPGYLSQEQESLDPEASALQAIQAIRPEDPTEVRAFLHHFLFTGDAALRPARHLSYGERSRLGLAALVAGGCNLLLLDEPTNHLDIPSRERFEQALAGFGGTILLVTHDRYFARRFATERWRIEEGRLRREVWG